MRRFLSFEDRAILIVARSGLSDFNENDNDNDVSIGMLVRTRPGNPGEILMPYKTKDIVPHLCCCEIRLERMYSKS